MTETSRMLANALLEHHRTVCIPHGDRPPIIDRCVITYGELCRAAGTPGLERGIGRFLQEIAEWCDEVGHPPLNSLAVNSDSRMPGESYDVAPGCSIANWPTEAIECILYADYPMAV